MRYKNILTDKLSKELERVIFKAVNEAYSENFKRNGKYYINMDVNMPNGGRTAHKMSDAEFYEKIKELRKEILGDKYENTDNKNRLLGTFAEFRYKDGKSLSKLKDDLKKITHDLENCDVKGGLRHHDGLPYILMSAGGDWEFYIYFMIYYDGKNFRGYIPEHGNVYNRDTMTAIGNDHEADRKFVYNNLKKYISDEDDDELATRALRNLSYIDEEIIEDFEKRVVVKK